MKRHPYLLNLLFVLVVISCGQNSAEENLNGKWYAIENDGYTRMHFYPDSLVFREMESETTDWQATDSRIEFELPRNIFVKDSSQVTIEYNISESNDSLYCLFNTAWASAEINFLKADSYNQFLQKKYNTIFSLPKDNTVNVIETDSQYGLKIFMSYMNNQVVGRTELTRDLNQLSTDILKFKSTIQRNERVEVDMFDKNFDTRFHLRVFADKEIPDSLITNHLKTTVVLPKPKLSTNPNDFKPWVRDSLPIRVFRIYESKEEDDIGRMRGKKISTKAINVYRD